MSSRILFICTGNFYRSRFAEAVFNNHPAVRKAGGQAVSRGLATHLVDGCGPISLHTVEALASLKIELSCTGRGPVQLSRADLDSATRIIALKEAEHRPMLEGKFPDWADRVEYWQVHDLDMAQPAQALGEIQELVQSLVDELHGAEMCADDVKLKEA